MRGNIKMNDNLNTGLTNPPNNDDEATNKKYVDDSITKSHIKPSHTPKNVFQYLMDDVNEWSSQYKIKVDKFINLQEGPHSWDKRVLKVTPVKIGSNYRFRLGLQMFRMKTNETYSLMVERYNRDYKTWQREQTFVNGTGVWVRTYNITKLQYHYGVNNTLYYTKTLIKFKKTSSSAPVFVYYTVHFDDNGGDLNTYPKDFINQIYLVAYGVEGLADNVDPEVYDAHEAFEIDKTKMKMLVPLDMNGKQLMNVNYGAFDKEQNKMKINMPLDMNGNNILNLNVNLGMKFSDIFTWEECYVTIIRNIGTLIKVSDDTFLSPTTPTVVCLLYFGNTFKGTLTSTSNFYIDTRRLDPSVRYKFTEDDKVFYIFKRFQHGFSNIRFFNITNPRNGNNRFSVNVLLAKG